MEEFVNYLSTPEGSIVVIAITSVTMVTIVNITKKCDIGVKVKGMVDVAMNHVV